MKLHFKTNKNRISINFATKTYKLNYLAEYYVNYITLRQYEFNELFATLKVNGFDEYQPKHEQ